MGKKKNVTTAASSFVDENSATFSKNVDVPCEGAPEASATALPAAHPPFSVLSKFFCFFFFVAMIEKLEKKKIARFYMSQYLN